MNSVTRYIGVNQVVGKSYVHEILGTEAVENFDLEDYEVFEVVKKMVTKSYSRFRIRNLAECHSQSLKPFDRFGCLLRLKKFLYPKFDCKCLVVAKNKMQEVEGERWTC